MKDKLPKPGKIGAGSGDIGIGGAGNTDPSWIPNGDGITNSTDTI